ncbi:hypothetical protein [Paraburkholderia caribensis]|nr:hypothetical protein [Paraburkholderia caribensis]
MKTFQTVEQLQLSKKEAASPAKPDFRASRRREKTATTFLLMAGAV